MIFRRLAALGAIVIALVGPAHAQKTKAQINTEINAQFPDNTQGAITPQNLRNVTGDIVNAIMPTAPVTDGNQTCFNGTTGALKDCGAPPILSIVSPLQLVGGALSCPTCQTSSAGANVYASRTIASGRDLSTFTTIQTLSYNSATDGGGATFENVGSAAFLDAQPLTGTISAAGSGYVNGSYTGVPLSSVSNTCRAFVNVTVSGTAVTAVSLIGLKGAGCKGADVVSTANNNLGGSGSGFTWTVATVSPPLGSFTDLAGNHWQIAPGAGGMLNVAQFGAVGDWTASGGDATATDNGPAFNASQIYASSGVGSADAGGFAATTILVPKGTYKICGGLITADGATLRGLGTTTSILKQCDSDSAATHFVTICNPQSFKACFGSRLSNLQLFPGSGSANSNVAMIYTNNAQQNDVINNVAAYGGKRMCLFADTGYGGAANFISKSLFCTTNSTSAQSQAIAVTYGAAAITFTDTVVESGGAYSGSGFFISTGGTWSIRGGHSENIATPIFTNITGANTTVEIFGYTGGANCTSVITRQGGSTANVITVGRINPNGCTNAINNGGTPTTGLVNANTTF